MLCRVIKLLLSTNFLTTNNMVAPPPPKPLPQIPNITITTPQNKTLQAKPIPEKFELLHYTAEKTFLEHFSKQCKTLLPKEGRKEKINTLLRANEKKYTELSKKYKKSKKEKISEKIIDLARYKTLKEERLYLLQLQKKPEEKPFLKYTLKTLYISIKIK